jgi:L-rhamnose mutarotase
MEDAMKAIGSRVWVLIAAIAVLWTGGMPIFSVPPGVKPQRYAAVIGLCPERVGEYTRLHANVWPDVLVRLRASNIRNYSIYLKEIERGKFYLFSYYEYIGSDYAADMARLAADPVIKKWWELTDPCQIPIPLRGEKEFWAGMREVFHME